MDERMKSIIIRPLLTEKMTVMSEKEQKYAFQVMPGFNKIEIKKAVEERFGVHVTKIATVAMKGKSKSQTVRSGGKVIRTRGRRSNWKKAIVTLKQGERIDLYEGDNAV